MFVIGLVAGIFTGVGLCVAGIIAISLYATRNNNG